MGGAPSSPRTCMDTRTLSPVPLCYGRRARDAQILLPRRRRLAHDATALETREGKHQELSHHGRVFDDEAGVFGRHAHVSRNTAAPGRAFEGPYKYAETRAPPASAL